MYFVLRENRQKLNDMNKLLAGIETHIFGFQSRRPSVDHNTIRTIIMEAQKENVNQCIFIFTPTQLLLFLPFPFILQTVIRFVPFSHTVFSMKH